MWVRWRVSGGNVAKPMKPHLFLLTAATTLLLASAAHARLGETEGQSQQRYGQPREDLGVSTDKPLLPGGVEKTYEYQGFRVRAAFAGGLCVRIEYARIPENTVPLKLEEAHLAAILEGEKGRFTWKEEKPSKQPGVAGDIERALKGALNVRKWDRNDHAKAELALGLLLKLETRDADDWEKKLARAAKPAPGQPVPGQPAKPAVPKF